MLDDIRLALRTMGTQKAVTSAALVTLALGIGANVAIFSVVYSVLLRPLPYPDPDRLVQISEVVPGGTPALPGAAWISSLSIHAWAPQRTTVGPIAHFSSGTATVGIDTPRRVPRGFVGPSFFDVLGLQPLRGRFFRNEDAETGAAPVVVISSELWREEFGGDATILGRTISIDDRPHQIVGVAPPGVTVPSEGARFWTPVPLAPPTRPGSSEVRVEATRAIARLAPGASTAQAAAEATSYARSVVRPLPAEMLFGMGGPVEIHVRTLADQITLRVKPALLVLLSAVSLLLLIACANVANLFLSRGVSRERDLAVHVACGASRGRLIRMLMTESLVVSCLGGAVGVGVAWVVMRGLSANAPSNFPRLDAVQLDARALAVAGAAAVIAGLLAGLLPAWRGARPDLLPVLREGAGSSSSRRVKLTRRMLLVGEAALAVMLLIGATLLGRSFMHLMQTDTGYDATQVLTARVYLPGASRGQAQTDAFVTELLARLRALPGVEFAGASNMAPLGQSTFVAAFTMPLPGRESLTVRALSYVVTPGYAEALRLRLRRGRFFDERDLASGSQSLLVNEHFVRTFMPGVEPIGLRLPLSVVTDKVDTSEIIGVVDNVLKDSLDQDPQAEIYVPTAHGAAIRREIHVVLRTSGDPRAYADDLRQVVAELRPDAATDGVVPLSARLADSVAQPRFTAAVLLAFAALALLLAGVGLYSVLSYTVMRRRREIGVRAALGASRTAIVSLIMQEGMLVAMLGLIAGVMMAATLTRLLQTLLVGVQPLDAASFVLAGGTVLVVSLISCALPARRAAGIDPVVALRSE